MALRLELFGTPRVSDGGSTALLAATRRVALLVYLACRAAWVPRDELALLFRPDATDAEARRVLRKLVFRARSLPFAAFLEIAADRLRWPVACDLLDLRTAVLASRCGARRSRGCWRLPPSSPAW